MPIFILVKYEYRAFSENGFITDNKPPSVIWDKNIMYALKTLYTTAYVLYIHILVQSMPDGDRGIQTNYRYGLTIYIAVHLHTRVLRAAACEKWLTWLTWRRCSRDTCTHTLIMPVDRQDKQEIWANAHETRHSISLILYAGCLGLSPLYFSE